MSLLDSHPQLTCLSELFNPMDGAAYRGSGYDNPFDYLRDVRLLSPTRRFGFKLTYQDLQHLPALFQLLDDRHLRVLLLRRDNLLAQVTSNAFVAATSTYHSTSGPHEVDRVRIDTTTLLGAIYELFAREAMLAAATRCNTRLTIEYTDLNSVDTHATIERFLGIRAAPLASSQAKLVRRPLHQAIENWDEVSELLRGTVWERFLGGEPGGTGEC